MLMICFEIKESVKEKKWFSVESASVQYTAVSTTVVQKKRKSVRDNAEG